MTARTRSFSVRSAVAQAGLHDDAVAEHRDAVGGLQHLFHVVADEQHRRPGGDDVLEHVVEVLEARPAQRPRRLVEDDDPAPGLGVLQRPGDGDGGAVLLGEVADAGLERHRVAEPLEHRGGVPALLPPPDGPGEPVRAEPAHPEVLHHGEVVDQAEALVHDREAPGCASRGRTGSRSGSPSTSTRPPGSGAW